MKCFTINADVDGITSHDSLTQARNSEGGPTPFTTEQEFADVANAMNLSKPQLATLFNSFLGVREVKTFSTRAIGVKRIWAQLLLDEGDDQRGAAVEPEPTKPEPVVSLAETLSAKAKSLRVKTDKPAKAEKIVKVAKPRVAKVKEPGRVTTQARALAMMQRKHGVKESELLEFSKTGSMKVLAQRIEKRYGVTVAITGDKGAHVFTVTTT